MEAGIIPSTAGTTLTLNNVNTNTDANTSTNMNTNRGGRGWNYPKHNTQYCMHLTNANTDTPRNTYANTSTNTKTHIDKIQTQHTNIDMNASQTQRWQKL